MKRWVKWTLGLLIGFFVLLTSVYLIWFNEPPPEGHSPKQADILAKSMLKALNIEAYRETRYLEWTYRGGQNTYRWDKAMGKVEMTWGDYSGNIDLVSPEESAIYINGQPVKGESLKELTAEAISNFNNDSFWLVAPFKIFDPGTRRSLVKIKNGGNGILVTYTQGGDTPGDTYLWELDENNIPVRFRMWVQILPLKGLSASWEGWHETKSGVMLPKYHKLGPIRLDLGEVKAMK